MVCDDLSTARACARSRACELSRDLFASLTALHFNSLHDVFLPFFEKLHSVLNVCFSTEILLRMVGCSILQPLVCLVGF